MLRNYRNEGELITRLIIRISPKFSAERPFCEKLEKLKI